MMFDENRKLIDCCILVADCVKPRSDYEKTGGAYTFSYNYSVPIEKIEEAKKFIEETFKYFGQPCSRVYISGFAIQTESSIWTKKRIVEQVKMEAEKINILLQESRNIRKR